MRFNGKYAVITGASRGIGATIAARLAAEGAFVVVNYASSDEAAAKVVDAIRQAGGKAVAVRADVSTSVGVDTLFREVDALCAGRVDILVNNAGYMTLGHLEDSSDEQFDKTVNLNIRGVFLVARAALPRMTSGGRMINIGSIFSERMPLPGLGLYGMSKFAVAGFSRAWARDLADRGITVNCIQPGPVDTVLNPADGEFAPFITPLTAQKRYGATNEVAALVAFVASDEASYITGACLNVDGGTNA